MYKNAGFRRVDAETFEMRMPKDRDFKILQLTDVHLGFGLFSRKKDRKALVTVTTMIERTRPDLIIFTGDTVFPLLLKTGTGNNRREARKFMQFMDMFRIPYALIMGNHDTEIGSILNRRQLGQEFMKGEYSIFANGRSDIFGEGNYFINLIRNEDWKATALDKDRDKRAGAGRVSRTPMALAMLDSNMYGGRWLFGGFDRIHEDQTEWCMNKLNALKEVNPNVKAMAFFHMPLKEFKDAYEKMKLGDSSIKYHFGSIGEKEDYFGISRFRGDFFKSAHDNGVIKAMFCGHDHLNSLSLTYKGIRMTYGMSIDFNAYIGITKRQIQRGGTVITVSENGDIDVKMEPLTQVVSPRIRGMKELAEKTMEEMTRQADTARKRMLELEAERDAKILELRNAALASNARIKEKQKARVEKRKEYLALRKQRKWR